jgi:malonate transporter and related proteins
MRDVLNRALPYFSLIYVGFACGKVIELLDARLAWRMAGRRFPNTG